MLRRCAAQLAAQGSAAANGFLKGAAAGPARGGTSPATAAFGLARPYSSSTRETLAEATGRIRAAAAASSSALKAASGAAARAPGTLYRALPKSAQQLVNAAQTPGAVNRVVSLQLTAFWQNHSSAIIALAAAGTCYATWHALLRASGVFVDAPSPMAAAGFLAAAASGVAFGYLYLRRRYTIDPAAMYRLAMYRLNTHPGLLEVMGAPLVGSPVRASVVTGGDLRFRGLRPRLQSRRIQMIFPLKGAERRGLVSLEAKKRHGQLQFKLLAVDVPSAAGGEQRIFLVGGPALYERGGVLGVLRDPFIRALSMEEAFLAEDEAEDAEEQRERAAAAAAAAAEAAAKAPKPLDQGGGMYFHERVLLGARRAWAKLTRHEPQQALASTAAPADAAKQQQRQAPPMQVARAA